MARSVLLVSALLLPVLAGCVQPSDDGAVDAALAEDAAAELLPLSVTFQTCDEQLGVFPFPMAVARLLAPEGFTVTPFDPTGTTATLFFVAIRCDGASVDGAPTDELSEGFMGIAVAPPEALRHPDEGALHAVLVGHVTTSDAAQAAYESWGVTSSVGAVALSSVAAPVARVSSVAMDGDTGRGGMRMVTAQPGGEEAGVARLFSAESGQVTGGYDMAWAKADGAQGEAVLELVNVGGRSIPSVPGLGFVYWKDGDRYTKTPVVLPLAEE